MNPPIININDLEFLPFPWPMPDHVVEKFGGAKIGDIGRRLGTTKIGMNVTVVPPGKRAFPFHNHRVNEEVFIILEGSGEVRLGEETFPIKKGDVVFCAPGGPEHAHQIVNTSDTEIRYLAISSKLSPEIADYPDSKKFGVLAENFRFLGRADQALDYWDGE